MYSFENFLILYNDIFLSVQLSNKLLQRYHFTSSLSSFFLITYQLFTNYLEHCLICLLKFFFIVPSKIFFLVKVLYSLCPQNIIFQFFNHSNFFNPICGEHFFLNVSILTFLHSPQITLTPIFIITFCTKVNIRA